MVKKRARPKAHTTGFVTKHLDELLDVALEQTFPASDPIAINIDEPREKKEAENSESMEPR